MNLTKFFSITAALLLGGIWLEAAEDRDAKVLDDRQNILDSGFWIYNDLDKGIEQAKATGKPMLVVFRCVP